jgi:hypothetical protein
VFIALSIENCSETHDVLSPHLEDEIDILFRLTILQQERFEETTLQFKDYFTVVNS